MKKLIWLLPILLVFQGCPDEPVTPPDMPCDNYGLIISTGDSVCPLLIESNGSFMVNPIGFVQTPKTLVPGEYIWFSYQLVPDSGSACFGAANALIQCLEYVDCPSPYLISNSTTGANYPEDPFVIDSVYLLEDMLKCIVSYSGGCASHQFKLLFKDPYSDPQNKVKAVISHNANGDMCEAWITDTLCFNIVAFQVTGQEEVEITLSPNSLLSSTFFVIVYSY